jgi:UDP-glucose 4-epimerase
MNTKYSEISVGTDNTGQAPPTKWLITGGCGFIGTNLIENLTHEGGHQIRIVDNLSVGSMEDLARVCRFRVLPVDKLETSVNDPEDPSVAVELLVGDILDERLAIAAAEGVQAIVHLAANTGVEPSVKDPRRDCNTNVIGTLNYLEAARHHGIQRFVFASSGAPVGECTPPIHEELAPHPVSPYGASKLAGEAYCSAYFRTFGVQTVSLRFGNVYGPLSGHKNSVVAKFIRQVLLGETLEIYGDGRQTRDFIFTADLVRAIRQAATIPNIGGETFQIATNAETTVAELAQQVLPILADRGFPAVAVVHAAPRLGDVLRNFSDTSKAQRLLQWRAEVDLADGLNRTVGWFLQQHQASVEAPEHTTG